ncbi:type II toxin-antitoxin system Phd/YefM family antitoxin [Mesorhizobium sp. B1-1-8]|uniref:type II toxin-antitoxin system Phd/YefM family antitoxin n=1 Tax=Mesorhizobium sp. B1-1-8 TaxID=2589976 RepID=UPI00112605AF|nr:type II toxin-antitoxin system Phd/YefM family antitoxin [Mesorhizobium sp. B1-1-8]UCI09350.1 type II toxin-antitoxin system Phd/YefM family antitoxin [Mesorhizobium sp. B1-1-8]
MTISTKTITIMSSREFNQDTARAKRAARNGPVIITDRGEPSHVLMSMEDYEKLKKPGGSQEKFRSLADVLADDRPEADFDFDIPELKSLSLRPPEFD